jgi:hypothetical protein
MLQYPGTAVAVGAPTVGIFRFFNGDRYLTYYSLVGVLRGQVGDQFLRRLRGCRNEPSAKTSTASLGFARVSTSLALSTRPYGDRNFLLRPAGGGALIPAGSGAPCGINPALKPLQKPLTNKPTETRNETRAVHA